MQSQTSPQWKAEEVNIFKRWVNSKLDSCGYSGKKLDNFKEDFQDGELIQGLVKALTGHEFQKSGRRISRILKFDSVTIALEYLQQQEGVRLVNVGRKISFFHSIN